MDFSLTEEQVLLRDSVDKFVAENADVERHRTLQQTALGFDPAAWQQFASLGWLAIPFTEENGGFGGSASDLMVVSQSLGAGFVREPFLHTVVICGNLLQHAGSAEQQQRYIPAIIDGSSQWAFAFAERGADFDLERLETVASDSGGEFHLNGKKIAVLNAHCADHLIVSAVCEGTARLFLVDAGTPGLTGEPFVGVDGSRGAHIQLEAVVAQPLGGAVKAQKSLYHSLDYALIAMGAEALGAVEALLRATVSYTRTREQFGQPISRFQVLQHRMADMYMKVEELRALVFNATIQVERGSSEAPAACAALKVKLAEAARHVCQEAVQLHGGIGMTDELGVGHYFKRLLLLSKLFGDETHHLDRYIALTRASAHAA